MGRGAQHHPAEDPALPMAQVNPRTGGTCGGFAQPRGTGRSWEGREAGGGGRVVLRRRAGRRAAAPGLPGVTSRPSCRGHSGSGGPASTLPRAAAPRQRPPAPPRAAPLPGSRVRPRPRGGAGQTPPPELEHSRVGSGGGVGAGEVCSPLLVLRYRAGLQPRGPGVRRVGLRNPTGPQPSSQILLLGKVFKLLKCHLSSTWFMQLFVSYGNKVRWILTPQMNKKVWKLQFSAWRRFLRSAQKIHT
ncbi:small glutamine-rich tetratricopeptide repeat-containing protein beta isoform X3 [Callithrix jacchus]